MRLMNRSPFLVMVMLLFARVPAAQDGWFQQESGTSSYLLGVFSIDSLTCWVTGSLATILNTTDGGETWIEQSSPVAGTLYGVFFTDASTGWVVGEFGNVLHTVDAGQNWIEQASGTNVDLWSVHFLDENNGWAAGGKFFHPSNRRIIISTSNGGDSWETQHYQSNKPSLHGIYFIDLSTGYAVGEGATILATTDGGTNWVEQNAGVTGHLEDVFFTSPDTGFVVGQSGVILYTIDGGVNWTETSSGSSDWLGGIWFTDDNTGWTVGGSNDTATILGTVDGGLSWDAQPANTDTLLRDVQFTDSMNGWAVGAYGMIVHTTTGGYTGIQEGPGPAVELEGYPNPSRGSITLEFDLVTSAAVSIQVFDITGRLVIDPVEQRLHAGEHSITVSPHQLEPGLYICRISDGSATDEMRWVLLR